MSEEVAAGGVPDEGRTGTGTEPGEIAPPAVCATCGAPYEWKRKWNSGNPKDILMSSCDCPAITWGTYKRRWDE